MKGDAWEAGHRVPMIVSWPRHTPQEAVSEEITCHTDFFATFAEIMGDALPDRAAEDSFSFLAAMRGEHAKGRRTVTVHQSSRRVLSIRRGDWKFIPQLGSGGFSKPRRERPVLDGPTAQLYNLRDDPSESKNLFLRYPQIVAELSAALDRTKVRGRSRP